MGNREKPSEVQTLPLVETGVGTVFVNWIASCVPVSGGFNLTLCTRRIGIDANGQHQAQAAITARIQLDEATARTLRDNLNAQLLLWDSPEGEPN